MISDYSTALNSLLFVSKTGTVGHYAKPNAVVKPLQRSEPLSAPTDDTIGEGDLKSQQRISDIIDDVENRLKTLQNEKQKSIQNVKSVNKLVESFTVD